MQVAALLATMECVRGEAAGAFNNQLYGRVVDTVVSLRGVSPEVVGLVVSRFLPLADVRYYTLRTLERLAERRAVRDGSTSGSGTGGGGGGGGCGSGRGRSEAAGHGSAGPSAGPSAAAGTVESDQEEGEEEGEVSVHDLARNMFDLLIQTPPSLEGWEGGEEGDGSTGCLSSWSGAAEAGLVGPANDAEGVRQRKRRRLQQQQQAPAAAGAAAQRAKWASAKHQRRAYSEAWLAFLRLDLPDDIYRKVLVSLHDRIIPALVNPLLLSGPELGACCCC